VALKTYSMFYYGHTITEDNRYINFKEGVGVEKITTLPIGSFTLTKFTEILSSALNAASALDWTVSVARATRIVTITASGTATLLGATGSNFAKSFMQLAGFAQADLTGTTFVGSFGSGSVFKPTFYLQDYKSKNSNNALYNAVVTRSASGNNVSIQTFGQEKLIKANIKWITNLPQGSSGFIRNDPSAVENVTSFLDYGITKAPIEFMEDESKPNSFDRIILESTPLNQNGTEYELDEYVDRNLPDWFGTGLLTFRIIKE